MLCDVMQVVCEVMSVHWDRLDVKIAVRYPKSYGPWARGAKKLSTQLEDDQDGNHEEDQEEQQEEVCGGLKG